MITKGITVTLDTGAAPGGSTPLGTGTVEVFGTLQLNGDPSAYNGTASFFNNATSANANSFILRPGGQIVINDQWGQVAGGQGRWADATGIDLNGGTFRFNGAQSLQSVEKIGDVTVSKGGQIVLARNSSGSATLNIGALTRNTNGTLLLFPVGANTLGIPGLNPTAFERLITTSAITLGGLTTNGPGVVNGGLAPVWIVDATANSYVGYDSMGLGSGFQTLQSSGSTSLNLGQLEYSNRITAAGAFTTAALTAGTATVDMSSAQTLGVGYNPSIYALRTNVNITGDVAGNSITITSGGLLFNGSPTINPSLTAVTTRLDTAPMQLNFGTAGAAPATIFVQAGQTANINAQINAAGLVKFGTGNLILRGSNTFTGDIIVNQGALILQNPISGTGTAINTSTTGRNIILNGNGAWLELYGFLAAPSGRDTLLASGVQLSSSLPGTITVNGDSFISYGNNNNPAVSRFGNLVLADLGASTPITLSTTGNVTFAGTTTLGANNNVFYTQFYNAGRTILEGVVSGGRITKLGAGSLEFMSSANTFGTAGQLGLDVYANNRNDATSTVQSLTRTGTPFGVGDIVLNPGSVINILSAANIAAQKVVSKSDGNALSGLVVGYNILQSDLVGLVAATPTTGKVSFASTGRYLGGIGLGGGWQYNALDLGAVETAAGGGKLWLGSGGGSGTNNNGHSTVYFAPTLGAGTDGVYRIGFGGNQHSLILGNNGFENILTGTNSLVLGANVAEDGTATAPMINGNMSTGNWTNGVSFNNRNNYSGGTIINPGTNVRPGNNFAFGTGKITINQVAGLGAFRIDGTLAQVTLQNEIDLLGDLMMRGDGTSRELLFLGGVNLSPGGVSASHTIFVDTDNTGANQTLVGFLGGVSGAIGSNLIKTGSGTLLLRGNNTYQGTTTLSQSRMILGSDALTTGGALGVGTTPLIVSADGAVLFLGGNMTLGRDLQISSPTDKTAYLIASSLYRTQITGTIQATTAGANGFVMLRTINRGLIGTLDITGNITGTGQIRIGGQDTSNQDSGVVRLLNSVNGFSTNNNSGGVCLEGGRLFLAGDALWSGAITAPVIVSGPLGTGTFKFGTGGTDGGTDRVGSVGSTGQNLIIPNLLDLTGGTGRNGEAKMNFDGRGDLNFIRSGYAINIADGDAGQTSPRARTFNVTTQQGVISIGGDITLATTASGNLPSKSGLGILVYNGENKAGAYALGSGNTLLGTSWQINAGSLVVSKDTSLGLTFNPSTGTGGMLRTPTAYAGWTTTRSTLVNLNGGTLSINGSFTTDHQYVLAANSFLNVTQGNTFNLRGLDQALTGAGGAVSAEGLTGAFNLTKTGLGAFVMNPVKTGSTNALPLFTGVSTNTGLTVGGYNPWISASATVDNRLNSVTSSNLSGNPFVGAAGALVINGGLLGLANATGASQTLATTGALTYGGGGYLSITAPTGAFVNTLTVGSIGQVANTKGTLTILGANLATFGQGTPTQKLLSTAAPATTGTRGIIDAGSIVIRAASANSDATFANYTTAHGFTAAAVADIALPKPISGLITDGTTANVTLLSTAGLSAGMVLVGPGITPGTTIQTVNGDGTTLVLNAVTTAAGSAGVGSAYLPQVSLANVTTTVNSSTVTVTSTSGLTAGMVVAGPNIPAGSTVVSVTNSTQFVISSSTVTAAAGGVGAGFSTPVALNSLSTTLAGNTVTVASNTGLIPGMMVSGPGIPSGARILALVGSTQFTMVTDTGAVLNANATTSAGTGIAGQTYFGKTSAATTITGLVEQYGLQLGGNLTLTNAADTLRLVGGGLIMNGTGATGPTISGSGTLRFGNATTALAFNPADAYVFVREGQTGTTSAINTNFVSADFIKSGAGNLVLGGSANVMPVPITGTSVLRTLFVQEGSLSFSGASSVPTGGGTSNARVNLQVNDTGTLDLNGLGLTFGSLAGTGFVTNNNASASTLTLNTGYGQTGQIFTGVIRDGAGSVALVKSGLGTTTISTPLAIGNEVGANAYSGGTTINAGYIQTANVGGQIQTGLSNSAVSGRLIVNNPLGLGTGPITLAGGILSFGNTVGIEVVAGLNAQQFGAGKGYDLTVDALNNFGTANVTSIIDGPTAGATAVINNLTVNSAGVTFAGGSNAQQVLGMTIAGTANFTQPTTTLSVGYQFGTTTVAGFTLAGDIVANAGAGTIIRSGVGRLYLTEWNQTANSQVAAWTFAGGDVVINGAKGRFNVLGNNAPITLNDTVLYTRYDGDGSQAFELITTHQTNNLIIGSLEPVTSSAFSLSKNSTLNHERWNTGTAGLNLGVVNKTVLFQDLVFGGAFGSAYLTVSSGTGYIAQFRNLTATRNAYLSINNDATVTGTMTGTGTIYKQGGGSLFVGGDSGTTMGGFVQNGGITFFGTRQAGLITLSDTAKLTGGNILSTAYNGIQFNAASNVPTGWTGELDIRSRLGAFGHVRIAGDFPLTAINLRVGGLGGAQDFTNSILSYSSNAAGLGRNAGTITVNLNAVYTQNLDLSKIGDGTAFLGSTTNVVGLRGTYNGSSLGVGAANTYRLGAGGDILYFGSNGNANVVTDKDNRNIANLLVGAIHSGINQFDNITGGYGRGTAVFLQDQNYTGSTVVNYNSTLEARGKLATTSAEVFGNLILGGLGGTVVKSDNTGNVIADANFKLRPNGMLRFDYATGILPVAQTEGTGGQGRWHDNAPITLDSATLSLIGNRDYDVTEKVGVVTAVGGSAFEVRRDVTGRTATLELSGLIQAQDVGGKDGNNGVIRVFTTNNPWGLLGSDERVKVTGGAASMSSYSYKTSVSTPVAITNGMLPPWITSKEEIQFVTYVPEFGFVNAGYDRNWAATTFSAAAGSLTDRANFTGSFVINTGVTVQAYAMLMQGGPAFTSSVVGVAGTATLQVLSGGIIYRADNGSVTPTLAMNKIIAGDGITPADLYISGRDASRSFTIGDAANASSTGQLTNVRSLNYHGVANLDLNADQQTFAGNIIINSGNVLLRTSQASGTFAPAGTGNVIMNARSIYYLRGDGSVTFKNGLVIGLNNPRIEIQTDRSGASGSNGTFTHLGGLQFMGSSGEQGQAILHNAGNGFRSAFNGALNLGPDGNNANLAVNNGNFLNFNSVVTGDGSKSARLIKSLDGILELAGVSSLNDWTGGLVNAGGTTIVRGATTNTGATFATTLNQLQGGGLGNGAVTLYKGLLDLRYDAGTTGYERVSLGQAAGSVSLIVNGSAQINVAPGAVGTSTNKLLSFKDLTIGGNYHLNVQSGTNGYALDIFGKTYLRGNATIDNNIGMILNGEIDDNAGGITLFKYWQGSLWINDANTNFSGGLVANGNQSQESSIRFGAYSSGANSGNALATLGSGQIRMNPNTVIHLESNTNITGARQLFLSSAASHLAVAALRPGTGNANGVNYTQSYLANLFTTSSSGVLALEGNVTFTNALDQSAIGNGRMFLGVANLSGVTQGGNYAAASLSPGSDNVYRLGGGEGTLWLDFGGGSVTTGALSGTAKVLAGQQAQFGTGTVATSDLHTYTGGTIINRGTNFIVNQTPTATSGPLGASGTVDVFGQLTLRYESTAGYLTNGSLVSSANGNDNAYAVTLHPGSRLELDGSTQNIATMINRFGDTTPLILNGAILRVLGPAGGAPTLTIPSELIGDLTVAGGSSLGLYRKDGNGSVGLQAATFTRSGAASLLIDTGNASYLGVASGTPNNIRFVIGSGAPIPINGMVAPWMVSYTDQSFLNYPASGSVGFATVPAASYVAVSSGAFTPGLTTATDKVDITAAVTLQDDPVVYALRTNSNITSGTGQYNTATIVSGGLIVKGNSSINANLKFGATGSAEAAIYVHQGVTASIYGDLTAGSIVMFGTGLTDLYKDQTTAARGTGNGLSANWSLNQGRLNLRQFGSAGSGDITIWGTQDVNQIWNIARQDGRSQTTTMLGLYARPTSVLAANYSFGTIYVKDQARVYVDTGSDDRTIGIGAISVDSSDTTGLVPAHLRVEAPNWRTMVMAGPLTLTGGSSIIDTYWTLVGSSFEGFNKGSGAAHGLSVASLNNAGSLTAGLLKWGNAALTIRGESPTFAGPVTIEDGAIQVNAHGALGSGPITVNRYGALDINKAGWTMTNSSLTYNADSVERWSADGARKGQTVELGAGTLQVNADQFVSDSINAANNVIVRLNGGGIEGWLRGDDNLDGNSGLIYRTLGAGVSFQLLGDSFVGQNITASNNGLNAGRMASILGTLDLTPRGVILEVLGGFSGAGKLTKQGYDTVILSGASTHTGGTHVLQGTLRIGATDVLPTTGALSTAINGVFDLNGFAQTVGTLSSNNATVAGVTSGFIVNGATNTVALTVGNGSSANTTYHGQIQTNVALVKTGTGTLTLTNANTYIGGTTINGGTLEAANTGVGVGGSATGTGTVTIAGGTLAGSGSIGSQVVLNSGNLKPGAPSGTGTGTLTLAGLTINGGSLNFRLDAPTSTADDMIRITAVDVSSSLKSLQLNGALTAVNITALSGFKVGTYSLIDYSAAGASLGGSFATTFAGAGVLYPVAPSAKYFLTVQDNTVDKRIDLLVQANTSVVWSGLGIGNWDTAPTAGTKNWQNLGASPSDYTDGFDVVFNDAATNTPVSLIAAVRPLSVTVSGTKNFTLTAAAGTGFGIKDKATLAFTATTDGSKVLTFASGDTSNLTPGMTITGNNIAAGSVIDSVDDLTHVTLTKNTLGTGSSTDLVGSTQPTFTKLGTGTLTLNVSDNTYSGATFLVAGTLVVGASSAFLGDAGPFGTGVLNLNGGILKDNGTPIQIYNNIVVGGNVTFDSTDAVNGSLTFNDFGQIVPPVTFALGVTSTLTVNNTTTLSLGVTGAGKGFTKAGSGELILASSANTYTGLTTVNNGKLTIAGSIATGNAVTVGTSGTADFANPSTPANLGAVSNSGILNLNSSSQSTIVSLSGSANGVINLSGVTGVKVNNGSYLGRIRGIGKLTKDGIGADNLVLDGNASDFSGGVDLNAGTLSLNASSVLDSGTQAILTGPLGTGMISVGPTGGSISTSGDRTLHNSLTLNGDLTVSGSGLTFSDVGLASAPTITLAAASAVTFNTSATLTLDQVIGGSANLTKNGGGVLTLAKANNAYSGTTTINAGILAVASLGNGSDSLGSSSSAATSLVINNNATLRYIGSGSSTSARLFTVGLLGATFESNGTGTLVMNGTGAMAWSGAASARTLTLTGTSATANSLSALISDTGTATNITSILKTGGGTWGLLSTTSTFTGATTVSGGILQVGSLADGGVASSLGMASNVATNLTLSGGALLQWGGSTNQSSNKLFQITVSGGLEASGTSGAVLNMTNTGIIRPSATVVGTLLLGGAGGTLDNPNILAGQLTDNGGAGNLNLTKTGTGVWKLTNTTSTFGGTVTLSGGKLVVDSLSNAGSAGVLGASNATAGNFIFSGGTLTYRGSGFTVDRLFKLGAGDSGIESSGTAALDYISTASIGNDGSNSAPRSLTLGGTYLGGANIMGHAFSDAGTGLTSLIKAGPGTWTLSGSSTFTGGVTLENGLLNVLTATASNGGLGNGTPTTNVVRLGNANSTGDVTLAFGPTAGMFVGNPVVVSDLLGANSAKISVGNTSGTTTLGGNITLGSTANAGKSLTLAVPAGGTLAVAGKIQANGTDTSAGVNLVNSTGSGNATVAFTNNNTHAGFTTVNANTTLVINNALNGLGANSAANTVNLAGGTLKYQDNRYVAGLKEAYTRSAMDTSTAFESLTYYGVTNSPKMGYITSPNTSVRSTITDTAWGTNETWAYKGQVYIPASSPQISFSKSIDDAVWISLNGTVIMNDGSWTNLLGTGARSPGAGVGGGWHNFEVRFGNGAGGAGAQAQGTGWTTTHGFGVSGMLGKALDTALTGTNGNNYAAMVDSGGSLFRFDSGAINNLVLQNTINVTANSAFDQGADIPNLSYGKLILSNSTLTTDATGAPGATSLSFGSTTPIGTAVISNIASSTLNLGALDDAGTAATLNFNGAGTLVMNTASTSLVAGSVIGVNAGKIVSSHGTALANATINVGASVGLFEVAGSQSIAGLTGSGSVTLNGYNLSIGAADNLSTTFTGVISDGTTAGGLIKTGTGTLTLSGANTFTGALTVNAGTLKFGSLTAAGTTAAGTTVDAAGTIDLNGLAIGNEAITLAGTLANSASSAASLAAGVTLTNAATVSVASAGPIDLNGVVTGTGSLAKTGNGVLTLNGANDYIGGTTVSMGTIKLGHATALGGNAVGTTVAATGTLDVNGFSVASQPLALSGSLTNSSATAASLSGAITLGAGTATLVTNAGSLTLTGGLDVSSFNLTIGGTADVTVSGSSGLTGTTGLVTKNGAGKLTLNTASTAGFDTINAGQVDAAGAINVATLANGTLNAASSATVGTMNLGALNIGANSSVDNFNGGSINVGSSKLTVNAAATITADVASLAFTGGELNYTGAAPFTRSFTVGNGGVTFTAASTSVISIGSSSQVDFANTTGTGRTLTLKGDNVTNGSTFAPTLFDNTEATDRLFSGVVKNGVGTWVIGGSGNAFKASASFDVTSGLLGFSSGALAGTGLITVSGTSALRWEASNTNDVSGRLVIADAATATLNVGSNNVSFGAALGFGAAKTGAIVKQGAGELTLTQSNDFSGGVTVAAGTVTVNHVTALGSGLTVVNAGQLNLGVAIANNVTVNSTGVVKGAATSGTMTLNSGATLSSGNAITTYNGGSVILNGGSVLEWKAYDTAGGAGVGYDRFDFGNLDLTALSKTGAKATIKLISHSDLLGTLGDANLAGSHSTPLGIVRTFNFGTVSGNLNLAAGQSVTDVFTFDVSSFSFASNTPTTSDVWSMSFESGALTLTAVPEPSTYGFGIGALALALAAIRRRRKQIAAAKKNEA